MSPFIKTPVTLSDSVSSRVSRALRKAASKRLSGFTLAELIVVVAVLAILATVGFLALSGYSSDARDAKAKANVRSVVSAISSESALTGNSPRWYVSHDPDYALSGAYLYVDGTPVALTGGNAGEAPADSNYTAGTPRWDRLKLDPEDFRTSGISAGPRLAAASAPFLPGSLRTAFLPSASAAFDKAALSVGAADVPSASAA
jgi:prepilin-type N-terminal cleavage/methylation domain-containing protein